MKRIIPLICLIALFNTKVTGQSFSWAQGFLGTIGTGIGDVAFDTNNNLYVIGGFSGTLDVDRGIGVYNLTAVGNGNMFILKEDAQGNFLWVKHFPGITNGVNGCSGVSLHVDQSGNIYMAGFFRDSFDFDPGPSVYKLSSFGGYHSFVLKLDSLGNFIWVKDMGSHGIIGNMQLLTADFDKEGNIYFAASIGGTAIPTAIDVDPGPAVYNITSTAVSGNDFIIEKLDSAGNFKWVKQITGPYDKDAVAIALDSLSNIYLTGGFTDTVDFDPGAGVAKLYSGSSGGSAIFVAKYDSAGNYNWVKQIGVGGNNEASQGISLDPYGNVIITGYFSSIVDFDPGPGTYNLTSPARSIFTLKLRNNGDFAWARMVGDIGNFEGYAVATDSTGSVYTAAHAPGGCDLDPSAAVYNVSGDCVVQKLDSSGNFVWGVGWEGDIPGWIMLDHSNNVYTTGTFSGTNKDFDPGPATFLLSGNFNGSGFIEKLNQSPSENTVDNISSSGGIQVYPNPSSGVFTFSSPFAINHIDITDMTGKVVYMSEPNKTETSIDISGDASGIYFYTIITGKRKIRGKLLVNYK